MGTRELPLTEPIDGLHGAIESVAGLTDSSLLPEGHDFFFIRGHDAACWREHDAMVRAYDQEDRTSSLVVAEYTVTPERTLAAAGIDDAWQAEYQRKPVLGIRLCEIPNHRHDASWRQPCEICEVLYPPRDLVDWICARIHSSIGLGRCKG